MPDNASVFGQVVWLMMNSPDYKHLFLTDLEWMILPPILLGQYKLFLTGHQPIAFAAWAYLSEAAEERLTPGKARLQPAEWKSGDRLWLVHVIAPFGETDSVLKDLRETVLKGKSFKFHRRGADGGMTVEVSNA